MYFFLQKSKHVYDYKAMVLGKAIYLPFYLKSVRGNLDSLRLYSKCHIGMYYFYYSLNKANIP